MAVSDFMNTKARVDGAVCTLEVMEGRWPEPIHVWQVPQPVVAMSFWSPDYLAEGYYSKSGHAGFRPLGKVSAAVSGEELVTRGSSGPLRILRCVFNPSSYEDIASDWGPMTPDQLQRTFALQNPLIHILLRNMMQEAINPGYGGQALIDGCARALLVACAREIRGSSLPQPTPPKASRGFQASHLVSIENYLEAMQAGVPTLAELADACGIHPASLNHLFKKYMGQSVRQYLVDWRIRKARQLLAESDLPLKEIAYRLGFANPANFSTAFRKQAQLSPGAFRREWRGD